MIPRMRSSPLVAAASAMKLAISMWSGETSCSVPESLSLRSEEHTSELQSPCNLVCRLLLEKKKNENYFVIRFQVKDHPPSDDLARVWAQQVRRYQHILSSESTSALLVASSRGEVPSSWAGP